VRAELHAAAPAAVAPGEPLRLKVRLRIDPGWHIYAAGLAVLAGIPTAIELEPNELFESDPPLYPEGEPLAGAATGEVVRVYAGDIDVALTLRRRAGAGAAASTELAVRVRCQPCDDQRCLAPRVYRLALPVALT